ncbi:DNA end-binding protein Ku [Streptomyces puniciscabiei]|uniref:Non-homologous end joining protein Ku n=1 Tax=Streptomyces puniciscabiei TaxID=164348 RepID=A0A542SYU8_9ACTN|nr:Ku protein [Streptomyces puniciscabiei]TQK79786.1 DNA end-binding protein Ku [Streptomyces puniciscabiei]
MARPIWTGVLTFGLVTLPVGLYTATEDHTVHFHQLQRGTSDRIRNKRVNERTGKEVDTDRIVKGYEIDEGEYVVVEPEELEQIAPGRSKVIDLAGFVDLHQIEPVYFARTYYVGPRGKEYVKVYELMRAALDRADKAGIATLTMRGKEYLTALRAQPRVLVLHTLHWADEVRDPADVVPELPERRTKSDSRELRTAEQLIDALTIDWDPTEYHDTYEERVKRLVAAKREGEEVVGEPQPPEATNVIDLMDALSRSVEQSRSRGRKGGGGKPATGKKRATGKKQAAGRRESEDLGDLSKAELYERASAAGVPGRSRMTRDQLVKALAGQAA